MAKQITERWWFNALAGGVGSLVVAVAVGLMLKPVGHFLTRIPILGSGFAQFDNVLSYSDEVGLAAVKIGNKLGYIDTKGNLIVEPQFDAAKWFSSIGLAEVEINGKWGFISNPLK
ncbi:WG repeat-containing protein [Aerosakkonema funiforme]|uniref:WG repeat-containing protein n=1 Tax=Aerosakkonema funiforme FACHB-1375 TaxID=2949571 RepID=A0A926VCG5_9CYAN|nr:WG repeat-containing protein [Aerosakkonema funiforme]MBD2180843.1 WG repeat-containing protein [Aerosakkonema funiforme FACHB-1375]